MKIYTKTGDKGKTSLFNGSRILKSNVRVSAYGNIDELNSVIGMVCSQLDISKKLQKEIIDLLQTIQNDLFAIGSALSNPNSKSLDFLQKQVSAYENSIDSMTKILPPLQNFILPGGCIPGATIHLARTVCRRVERSVVKLSQEKEVDSNILVYFNRLSDLFFTMARYVNFLAKKTELIWILNG
jgi:cob(I)alamin adenosyltransferase